MIYLRVCLPNLISCTLKLPRVAILNPLYFESTAFGHAMGELSCFTADDGDFIPVYSDSILPTPRLRMQLVLCIFRLVLFGFYSRCVYMSISFRGLLVPPHSRRLGSILFLFMLDLRHKRLVVFCDSMSFRSYLYGCVCFISPGSALSLSQSMESK